MSSTDENTGVVLPAAGSGVRMGGIKKQHRILGGLPVWLQTLRVFRRNPSIGPVVVVVQDFEIRDVEDWLRSDGSSGDVFVVAGGKTRQESVHKGLQRLEGSCRYVLVHDAVRPFIRQEDIDRVLEAVRISGAASLAIPVADTLRRVDGIRFDMLVPRDSIFRMQTPQGFDLARLKEAHEKAIVTGTDATDDVALLQDLGDEVVAVTGRTENIKVTTPEDWAYATMIWDTWIAQDP